MFISFSSFSSILSMLSHVVKFSYNKVHEKQLLSWFYLLSGIDSQNVRFIDVMDEFDEAHF